MIILMMVTRMMLMMSINHADENQLTMHLMIRKFYLADVDKANPHERQQNDE